MSTSLIRQLLVARRMSSTVAGPEGGEIGCCPPWESRARPMISSCPKAGPCWKLNLLLTANDTCMRRRTHGLLWAGLTLLILQWGVFLRLTFFELSWDVMEPSRQNSQTSRSLLGRFLVLQHADLSKSPLL